LSALSLSLFLVLGCGPSSDDIAQNLQSDNPAIREDTAKIAKNFSSDVVVQALITALNDPAEEVRLNAVDSLVELEATEAVSALMVTVQRDSSDLVKRQAVDALGRLGDGAAVPVLIAYVEQRKAKKPPLNAIWALGNLEDPSAMPILSELRNHPDPYVAWNANEALRNLRP
jgi:HEAT repeat protein